MNDASMRVSELRSQLGITQAQMSKITGINQISISRIESGHSQPRTTTLRKIAHKTGVNVDWLLYGQGEMEIASVPDVQAEKKSSQNGESIWERALLSQLREQNSHLKKEVQFLREMLKGFAKNMDPANFNEAFDAAGVLIDLVSENLVKSGRVLKQCA